MRFRRVAEHPESSCLRILGRGIVPIVTAGLLSATAMPVWSAPSCGQTWPHAINVHGSDGNLDHKGQAWGIESNSANQGLLGAASGKVKGNGECYDSDDNLLNGCVADGPAESLGPPDFPALEDNNPPSRTVSSDETFTSDREFDSLTVENGATLTLSGPLQINAEGSVTIQGDGTVRVEGVDSGERTVVYAQNGLTADNGNVDVASAGTLELKVDTFTAENASDINCADPTGSGPDDPATPADKRVCGDTDGGVFVHSGSSLNLENSIARGALYADGNQGRITNQTNNGFRPLLQGAWTSGQVNVQQEADVVAGDIPPLTLCFSGGFHYAVIEPGSALTCEPADITIEAHADAETHEPTAPSDDTTIDVKARVVDGNSNPEWSNGSDTISYNFDGSETEETFSLDVNKDTTINIDLVEQSGTGTELSPDEDPNIVFSGSSLIFDPSINDQIAGKPSNQAPGDQTLQLKAVSCSGNTTSTDVFDGDKQVDWATECINPSDAGDGSVCPNNSDRQVVLDTEDVDPAFSGDAAIPSHPENQVDSYETRKEQFDDSIVNFALRHRDAGRIRLHARACTQNKAPSDCADNKLITAKSNPFDVRPFGFYLDFDPDADGVFDDRSANANCADQTSCAGDAGGDVFETAARDFPLKISAVVWAASDDGDDDGIPDTNQAIADNVLTPSFGQEDAAETLDLDQVLVAPGGGTAGTLSGGQGIGDPNDKAFSNGTIEVSGIAWDEVGIIDLEAALSDGQYLSVDGADVGTGDVLGTAPDVGRFIPARLGATGNEPAFEAFCRDSTDFTYLDQPFSYNVDPELTVTAYDADGGITDNYGAAFWQLPVPPELPNRSYTDESGAAATLTADRGSTSLSWADGGDDSLIGEDTATISGERLTYEREGLEAPFDAQVDLTVPAADLTDADGVCVAASGVCNTNEGDTGADFVFDGDDSTAEQDAITGTELRFGRLRIEDAFGPEIAPIEQRWQLDYWTGSTWSRNTDDTCTALSLADDVRLDPDADLTNSNDVAGDQDVDVTPGNGTTNIRDGELDVVGGEIVFDMAGGGRATVSYSPSGEGEGDRGWIEARARLATDFPHLIGDTDGDGTFGETDQEPVAGRVTFGIFAGQQEQIFRREVFPAP